MIGRMIDWLFDRWWVWKNAAELQVMDTEMDALQAQSERLDREMVEMFGPDWRREADRRLALRMSGDWTST